MYTSRVPVITAGYNSYIMKDSSDSCARDCLAFESDGTVVPRTRGNMLCCCSIVANGISNMYAGGVASKAIFEQSPCFTYAGNCFTFRRPQTE